METAGTLPLPSGGGRNGALSKKAAARGVQAQQGCGSMPVTRSHSVPADWAVQETRDTGTRRGGQSRHTEAMCALPPPAGRLEARV